MPLLSRLLTGLSVSMSAYNTVCQPFNKVLLLKHFPVSLTLSCGRIKLVSWLQSCVERRLLDKTPGPFIIFKQSNIA
jgi:hypothetical protein